ncbi:hypothetical protein [Chryseobacterium viscerum]|nr:hypothetical protein [Chryseobacterium viscerum]
MESIERILNSSICVGLYKCKALLMFFLLLQNVLYSQIFINDGAEIYVKDSSYLTQEIIIKPERGKVYIQEETQFSNLKEHISGEIIYISTLKKKKPPKKSKPKITNTKAKFSDEKIVVKNKFIPIPKGNSELLLPSYPSRYCLLPPVTSLKKIEFIIGWKTTLIKPPYCIKILGGSIKNLEVPFDYFQIISYIRPPPIGI